ncbi:programmed cell death protein 10-like [Daphnia carinata]|uniref:programmed cell death protein 10-like n=1 Tax=Daphnia carinata TaxID=120202 RepID=UPI0025806316|nr:programmed cell death protein 10-like [Daphnia carinata]
MTMGEESILSSLVMPILVGPSLVNLEKQDPGAAQLLKTAFSNAEAAHPSLCHSFILGLMKKAELKVNMNESLLRVQGASLDQESPDYRINRSEDAFQELCRKSVGLKKILSRIPDEIGDRKAFLETIKEIASAIKKLLDAVNEVAGYITFGSGKQRLEQRKREFVKYSKRFSTTLKEYFRDGQANAVFLSALCLIQQSNLIITTVKDCCE